MLELELKEKFATIFGFKSTRLEAPSDSHEQECLFIEIDKISSSPKDGVYKAMASGKISAYAQGEKLPLGYFYKRLRNADKELTKDLFFWGGEESKLITNNIVMRSLTFNYFFTSQYDPEIGNIESIEISEDT